jgi:DNA-binding CsgD family transcriptional regulator
METTVDQDFSLRALHEDGRAVVLEDDTATDAERRELPVRNALPKRLALARAAAKLAMLDRLACAGVLLDRKARVVRLNRHAEALLGDGLEVRHGALVASDACSHRDLQQLMGGLRAGCLSPAAPSSRALVRRSERSPLIVEILPLAALAADARGVALALLVITDIERRPTVPEDLLRTMFGLTPAEARLACRLAEGASLDDVAEALGIVRNTARVQLRSVFAKTGTRRQGELIALLARLAR